jgi:hypothetical protein
VLGVGCTGSFSIPQTATMELLCGPHLSNTAAFAASSPDGAVATKHWCLMPVTSRTAGWGGALQLHARGVLVHVTHHTRALHLACRPKSRHHNPLRASGPRDGVASAWLGVVLCMCCRCRFPPLRTAGLNLASEKKKCFKTASRQFSTCDRRAVYSPEGVPYVFLGPRPRLQVPRAVFCYFGGATDAPGAPLKCGGFLN